MIIMNDARVRVNKYWIKLNVFPSNEFLEGNCSIDLNVKRKGELEVILNRGLRVLSVTSQGKEVPFTQLVSSFDDLDLKVNSVRIDVDSSRNVLEIRYEGEIRPYEKTFNYVKDHISEEYTLIRPDSFSYPIIGALNFLELLDAILSQSFDYRVRVSVPEGYVVANLGELKYKRRKDDLIEYVYESKFPSWRIDIAIGNFDVISSSDGEILIFSMKEDARHASRILNHTKAALDFYVSKFGRPVTWKGYTIIEIPSGWGGQADVCGILLSRDVFVDPRRVRNLYHEIAHLWNVRSRDRSRFLDEGFASYFQVLAEKNILGADLDQLLERTRAKISEMCEKTPVLEDTPLFKYGEYKLTDASYFLGVWILHILNSIVGEKCFEEIIRRFLREFKDGAELEDFMEVSKEVSGKNLDRFFEDWFFTTRGLKYLLKGLSEEEIVNKYLIRYQ